MSRHRGRPAPQSTPTPSTGGAPIVVNRAQLQIGDIALFARLSQLQGTDSATQTAMLAEAIPMLDRIVVGGVSHRPLDELPRVMQDVARQIGSAADAGNSGRA